jgi:hypothetical protein
LYVIDTKNHASTSFYCQGAFLNKRRYYTIVSDAHATRDLFDKNARINQTFRRAFLYAIMHYVTLFSSCVIWVGKWELEEADKSRFFDHGVSTVP